MVAAQQAVTEYRVDASGATETLARLQEAADKATEAQERQLLGMQASANRSERAWQNLQARTDPVYRAQITMQRELERVAKMGAEAQERLGVSAQEVAQVYASTRQQHEQRIRDLQQQALAAQGIVPANDAAATSTRRLTSEMDRSEGVVSRLRGAVTGLVAAYVSMQGLRMLGGLADEWSELQARVNNAAGSMDAGLDVMDRIAEMARRTYSDLNQTAESWLSNSTALTELGYSTSQQLDLTETLNNAMVVSATRGQRAESVMRAWSEAMALGGLRGDQLNRVMTGSDRLAKALADSMGVGVNQLRRLGSEGKITTEVMFGVTGQLEKLRKEADEMPPTLADAATLFRNAMLQFVGGTDQASKTSQRLSEVVIGLADNFEHLVQIVGVVAVAAVGRSLGIMTANMIAYGREQIAATAVARQAAVTEQQAAAARLRGAEAALVAARANGQLSASYLILQGNVDTARARLAAADAQMAATTARARAATVAMAGLTRAIAPLGGPWGLALTAVAVGIGYWATRADEATQAMDAHRRIVDTVKKAYDEAGGATENWAKKIAETTLLQAEANLDEMIRRAERARQEMMVNPVGFGLGLDLEGEFGKQARLLRELQEEWIRTGEGIEAYKAAVDGIGQSAVNESIRGFAVALNDAADRSGDARDRVQQAEAVLRVLRGTATDADRALLGLAGSAAAAGRSMRNASGDAQTFADAMRELGRLIPEVAAQQRAHEQLSAASKSYREGLADLRREQQAGNLSAADYLASRNAIIERYRQAQDEVSGLASATRQLDQVETANRLAGLAGRDQALARVRHEYAEREASILRAIQHGASQADVSAQLARNEEQLAVALANTNAQYDQRAGAKATKEAEKEAERLKKAYDDLTASASDFVAQQQLEAGLIGLNSQQANALRYEFDLLNEARRAGIELTDADRWGFKALAEAMAEAEERTRFLTEAFDFTKDTIKGFFSDLRKGIEEGKGFWESFADAGVTALQKIADKLIDMALDQMINGVLRNLMQAFNFGGFSFGNTSYFPPAPSGGFHTLAGGGMVSGPGTSISDSIPAWLSDGEFVVRAAAVAQPGVLPLLEAINNGGAAVRMAMGGLARMHAPANTGVQRFAHGGLAQSRPSAQSNAAPSVTVNVQNNTSAQVEVGEPQQNADGSLTIDLIVNELEGRMEASMRGGRLGRAAQQTFVGLQRRTR